MSGHGTALHPVSAFEVKRTRCLHPVQVWPDKTSDAALAHFARSGLGAHRVELAPSDNPFGAKFVVRTNELASLEV